MGKQWKNPIKAENAAKKGAIFTKLAREIQVAARLGGPDPEYNNRLRMALEAAKKQSVPNDTIERAIKRGAGLLEGSQIEEILYEGYGPYGVGVLVQCQTDNRTRTVSELRAAFKKLGGNLGEAGSVAWMFERVGLIEAKKDGNVDPEADAIECDANDVFASHEGFEFFTELERLDEVRKKLELKGWKIVKSEPYYRAKNLIHLNDQQKKEVFEFLEAIDDLDDTHRVFATVDFSET